MLRIVATALMSVCAWAQQMPITVHDDIQYSDVARQPRRNRLDLFVPEAKAPPPLVMFVHGGSWTGGRKDGFRVLANVLASNGYACALINTQMFPFVKPDTMVADCGRALAHLHHSGKKYGFDGNQLFVMGHSSGAHLVSWLALDNQQLKQAGVPRHALRGAILLSGVYDVRCRHIALDGVFGKDVAFRSRATPWLYADKSDVPVFVAWGQRDLPGLSLCGRILRDRLSELGVPVCAHEYDCNHADYVFAIGTAKDRVMPDVLRFLRAPEDAGKDQARAKKPRRAVMWFATCESERLVGDAIRVAMLPHGVEVVVHKLVAATGKAVAMAFRQMKTERQQAQGVVPSYVGGIGKGGLAAATAPLSTKVDGLSGRIVVATPLGQRGLAAFDRKPADVDFSYLKQAGLLSLFGDQDPKAHRDEAMNRSWGLLLKGYEAHPIELANTTAEAALLSMRPDDDLLMPMLLAFLFP
jgi:acetyl esterase/lipase